MAEWRKRETQSFALTDLLAQYTNTRRAADTTLLLLEVVDYNKEELLKLLQSIPPAPELR